MSRPFYTHAAQQDLNDILLYIAADKPGAAITWVDKIEAKCLLIARNPAIGELQPHLGTGIRASVVGRYVIFHREEQDRVVILRVIPGDREVSQL